MTKIRSRRLYTIRPGMDAFSFGIMAICLCSGVNIKLDNLLAKKKSLFPALADLYKLLRNCLLSAASTIQSLLRIRPLSMSTMMIPGQGPPRQI